MGGFEKGGERENRSYLGVPGAGCMKARVSRPPCLSDLLQPLLNCRPGCCEDPCVCYSNALVGVFLPSVTLDPDFCFCVFLDILSSVLILI